MIQLPNHTLTEKVRESPSTLIYRGYRTADERPVIIKMLHREYPSVREVAKLEHEYRLLASLDLPGVVKVLSLERAEHRLAMVVEDLGGEPLSALIDARSIDLRTALRIALSLARTLSELHQRKILHKDIKPHNIVCNLAADRVQLIDFGIATRLGQETPRMVRPDALLGTLAYMSPEQTGRMNCGVDHRADLYSLGVTLYEMLTGVVPFQSKDPVELVHSHIARDALSPRERSPEIPEGLSAVVMKLLAKAPEDRYQSAEGLAADVETCIEQWNALGAVAPFPLGRRDRSDALWIPQKLYGREAQVEALMLAFARAAEGRPELFLVSGGAGVGKSALVHEIHRAIARRGGDFIAGKFDQIHRGVPFAAFTQAFRDLIRQILTEPEAALAAWKEKLVAALGRNGRVLLDLIPELEIILGPQPEVAHLEPTEAQNRLGLVFQDFVRAFCAPSQPLVVFLDDLQWADAASLLLMRLLLTDPRGGHLLLIGAYRDREVDGAHPLRSAVRELGKDGVTETEIALDPLDVASVRTLLAEALAGSDGRGLTLLAVQLFEKTHGNPFFLTQLLMTLSQESLLRLDRGTGLWSWDGAQIAAAPIAENVVDFMASKLQKLAPSTQRVLSLAACIGHTFDLHGLSTIAERPPAATAEDLWEALEEGLVVPLDADYRLLAAPGSLPAGEEVADAAADINIAFRFLHDRVQQAAYSLIAAEQKQDVHLRIGRLLTAKLPREPQAEALFEVVRHLNVGAARIEDPAERLALARANLKAGRIAKERAAFASAADLLDAGIAARGERSGEAPDELFYALHRERAECFHLSGRHDEAERELDRLLLLPTISDPQRADVHRLRVALYMMQARFADGLAAGRAGLALLGVTLPEGSEQCREAFRLEVHAIDQQLAARPIESLFNAPRLPPDKRLLMALFIELLPVAYWLDGNLAAFLYAKSASLSLEHGHAGHAGYIYTSYGLIVAGLLNRIPEAVRFARLGLRLADNPDATEERARTIFLVGLYITHGEPLGVAVECFRRGQEVGLETGDFMFASHASSHLIVACYERGDGLEVIAQEIEKSSAVLQRTKEVASLGFFTVMQRVVACLTGKTDGRTSLSDATFDEGAWLEHARKTGLISAVFLYHLRKLELAILHGDLDGAQAMIAGAEETMSSVPGVHWVTDFYFFASLAMAARAPSATEEEKPRLLATIARYQAKLAELAEHCPANEAHRHALVTAEVLRAQGAFTEAAERYDQAVALAHEQGFQHHEALANELCARFYLSRGRHKLARVYLTEARYGYRSWGATAKVAVLDEQYAELLQADSGAAPSPVAALPQVSRITSSETHLMPASALDLAAVLGVAQVIASEIVLDRLLDRMMRILLSSAGAQAGALILHRDERLLLAATATVNPDVVKVGLAEPLEGSMALPLSVVQFVARTREPIVLGAPEGDPRFSADPYLVARRPRSILALALMHHGSMAGVLYLENNAVPDAFPHERVQLLTVLSAPAAIAVENAVLYADVKAVSADLARSNELLRAANEQLSRELEARAQLQETQARMQAEIIQSQEQRLSELSTPLIPITDRIMVMPLIGTIDEARSAQMLEAALSGVSANRAEVVIIDITGVKVVESSVALTMTRLAAALRLLGTRVILTGIRPMVADALVRLGVDLGSIETRGTLKAGIASALGRTGERASL